MLMAAAEPLMKTLRTEPERGEERTALVRPGVFVAGEIGVRLKAWMTPSILCTSPFEQGSGVDHLLWAVGRLRQRGIHALVFLLGRGRFESTLRRQVRELGLNSQVTIAAPMGDPLDAMKGADVFVRPSRDAAFHVDSLQAMGMGLATVAYPSSVADHLHHDETACVCEAASGEALAEALARLIGDRAYTQRLAASAREYVRQHHSISQMAERTAAAYRRLALAHRTIPLPE
jgi:phosphatidylinositol alpha-1,6-mannosyltransferase